MDIEFASRRLEAASLSEHEASRLFGVPVGRKYIQRVAVMRAAGSLAELHGHRALRFHALKGDRRGQYALSLTGNYRLLIEKTGDRGVKVLSVEDYHGD